MPFFAFQNAAPTKAAENAGETPLDPDVARRELAQRWRAGATLEYRSEAVMRHAGEFTIRVAVHALLRRPAYARIVFDATGMPEAARVRVSDGRTIYDRQTGNRGERGRTLRERIDPNVELGFLTRNIPHPLDEVAYFINQFFAPDPFAPPPGWGSGARPEWSALRVSAARDDETQKRRLTVQNAAKGGDRLRLVAQSGTSRDSLTLDLANFAPLELVRVGEHAGQTQELLRETFTLVRLGVNLPASLFAWTDDDERGIAR